MIPVKVHTPKALVSFSTEKGDIVLRAEIDSQGYSIDNEVLSISTNNDIQADAGTFQITLADRNRWDKVLASNDFVRIEMYRDNDGYTEKNATVMIGLIDDVRRNVSIEGGTPQRVIAITGRTFAKALINFEVGVVQEVSVTQGTSLGWLAGRINFTAQPASSIVQQIYDELVFKYMNYEFKNGKTFKDLTTLRFTSRPNETLNEDKSFVNYQGSIQSFMREIINEPFNQMYWECFDDGKATHVVRETPFNKDTWNSLPTETIYDEDVVTDSIGRSDVETYTIFSVGIQNFFNSFDANQTMGVLPYWYEPYFKKFGLRRLHRYTGYIAAVGSDNVDGEKLKAYQQDLYNWNILNPSFYNGFITVKGDNKYKVGHRLLYLSEENMQALEFFVESVSHDFSNYGTWITKLGVTRGLENGGEDRFSDPWDSYTEYQSGALGEPIIDPSQTGGLPADYIPPIMDATGTAASVIAKAKYIDGLPTKYVWGGGRTASDRMAGRFDCSSFVHHCFMLAGLKLGGYDYPAPTTQEFAKVGTAVSIVQAQPGDIIFFDTNRKNGHIGIYLGGTQFIGCQGATGVAIADFGTNPYWKKVFKGHIRRVIVDAG